MLWSRFGYSLIIKRQSKTFLEKFWLSLTRKSLFSGIPILPWCKKLKMKQNDIRFIAHNDAKIKKVVGTHFASIEMHRTHAQVTNKIGICKLQLHIESHALLPCNTECLEFQSKLKNCLSMIAWWSLFAKNCGNVCKSVNVWNFACPHMCKMCMQVRLLGVVCKKMWKSVQKCVCVNCKKRSRSNTCMHIEHISHVCEHSKFCTLALK